MLLLVVFMTACDDSPHRPPSVTSDAGTPDVLADAQSEPDTAAPPPCLDDKECDDLAPCTIDSCTTTGCTHTPKPCGGHTCTPSTCEPTTGVCSVTVAPDGATCGKNLRCLAGVCTQPFATAIATGTRLTCVRRGDGTAWCWGINDRGQLGRGDTLPHVMGPVQGLNEVAEVAVGIRHACARLSSGNVRCWGAGDWAQNGRGAKIQRNSTAMPVVNLGAMASLAAGAYHTIAARPDGRLYGWGYNRYRQIYTKNTSTQTKATQIFDVAGASQWSAGGSQACGVWSGRVRCWGRNLSGESGRGVISEYSLAGVWVEGLTDVVHIDVGSYHACAVHRSGTVHCWGAGGSGRLGHGSSERSTTPVQVLGINDAVQVSAGLYHSCAVHRSGEVSCWGANSYGQLGDGTATQRHVATRILPPVATTAVPDVRFQAVSAGSYHTCGLLISGAVACWGTNSTWGELGWPLADGESTRATPTVIPETAPAPTMACQGVSDCPDADSCQQWSCVANVCVSHHTAAGTACDDGDRCTYGSVCGAGTCASGAPMCDTDEEACTIVYCNPSSGKCSTISNTALCDDGDACTWMERCVAGVCKAPGKGQTCDDGNACTVDSCDKVSGGCSHKNTETGACDDGSVCTSGEQCQAGACVHTASDKTLTCASNDNPCSVAVCDPKAGCVQSPRPDGTACGADLLCVEGACRRPFATSLTVGWYTTCIRKPGGTAACWGRNHFGQRGNAVVGGDFDAVTPVKGLAGVRSLRSGAYVGCAVLTDGTARCWGQATAGQLGDGKKTKLQSVPVIVKGLSNVDDIHPGYHHTCATHDGGQLACWGTSEVGEMAGPVTQTNALAMNVPGLPLIRSMAAHYRHSCAITEGGQARCWGSQSHGQLGRGGSAKSTLAAALSAPPAPVIGGWLGAQVTVGMHHSCGIAPNGSVWCWGSNSYGQIGDSTAFYRSHPVQVTTLTDVVGISAGAWHTCAVRKDGSVWCWGRSSLGQTGGSYASAERVPVRAVSGGVRSVAAGREHTCVLTTTGSVRCWGSNKYGNLGVGKKSWSFSRFARTVKGAVHLPAPTCKSAADCGPTTPCITPVCSAAGTCQGTLLAEGSPCDDGDACSASTFCAGGHCTGAKTCADGNPCTLESCAKGVCKTENAVFTCVDGDACILGQTCKAGVCSGGTPVTCDDKNPCTADACQPATGACTFTPTACGKSGDGNWIRGVVTWDYVPLRNKNQGGVRLDYAAVTPRPARRITMQAIAAGQLIATARTNDAGAYSLAVPTGVKVTVRALARVQINGAKADGIGSDYCDGATYDIRVVDNTNGKSVYALQSSQSVMAPQSSHNLHAAMVYQGDKYVKRYAGPFAILNSALQTIETACQGKKDLKVPQLTINWSVNNVPVSGTKSKGQIGSANHHTIESGNPQIYLKGAEDVSTAEYSQHTIAHETGHFLERSLFRSDTIGGAHTLGQILNPRTAFGEGFGNGLSGMVWGDPIYLSSSGKGQKGGFQADFSHAKSGDDAGFHSEMSVAYALYHLWDQRDTKPNSGSFDRIYAVLNGPQRKSPARTSMLTFVAWYNALYGSDAEGLGNMVEYGLQTPMDAVCLGSCTGKGDVPDVWDVNNDLGQAYAGRVRYPQKTGSYRSAAFWAYYPLLSGGTHPATAHDVLLPASYSAAYNKFGGVRHYRLKGTGKPITVSVGNLKAASCSTDLLNLLIYRGGSTVASNSSKKGTTAGCPSVTFQSVSAAWYVVAVQLPYVTSPAALYGWDITVKL